VLHSFSHPGTYMATFRVKSGTGEWLPAVTKSIEAYPPVEWKLPNVFTPNGDGANDILDILQSSAGLAEVEELKILDRNGQEVNKIEGPQWDGTDAGGEPCAAGTYIFAIRARDYSGKTHIRNGVIQLVP
jgi:gliding motility-associated-like protein